MKARLGLITCMLFALGTALPGQSQPNSDHNQKKSRSAGGEVASGSGDIGKGAAKGAGSLAAGTGKGAVDLVTLHPIDAAASVGKGGVSAGKNVAVGTTKGTAKIATGIGKGIKHIF
ncbi:MAG TPA: hypothetical protein VMA71_02785 [Alloacidobacterium sp.]|nr:hypothetical protein [Alloacidobacterium sp.]